MCGLEIQVDGGRVSSIRGNRDDVWSRGHLCPKGVSNRRKPTTTMKAQELELKTNTELTRQIQSLTAELHRRFSNDSA
jgi:hypothetical protein